MINPEKYIWLDGQLVGWNEAQTHVLSHTLHYGSGVFEGERAYFGAIFKIQEHHQRLIRSAELLGFNIPYSRAEIDAAAVEVLLANGLDRFDDVYVRPVAWLGEQSLSVSGRHNSVHLAVAAWRWPTYRHKDFPPLRLLWADWVRPPAASSPYEAKATGPYLTGGICKSQAELAGYNDALMCDYRGYVAECPGANIFMVKDGIVATPIADCFLNGITRQTVLEIGNSLGLKVEERRVLPAEIITADEVFVTGSAAEIYPVGEIGGEWSGGGGSATPDCKNGCRDEMSEQGGEVSSRADAAATVRGGQFPHGPVTKLLMAEYLRRVGAGR